MTDVFVTKYGVTYKALLVSKNDDILAFARDQAKKDIEEYAKSLGISKPKILCRLEWFNPIDVSMQFRDGRGVIKGIVFWAEKDKTDVELALVIDNEVNLLMEPCCIIQKSIYDVFQINWKIDELTRIKEDFIKCMR